MNNILKKVCKLNKFGFIDNSKICSENLFEAGLHINDDGQVVLTNKFIYVLKRLSYEMKNFVMTLAKMILHSKQIFITTRMSFPISQIVLE